MPIKEQSWDARETDSEASELEDDVMGLENTAFTHSGQLANIDFIFFPFPVTSLFNF